MSNLRRFWGTGNPVFITSVTFKREPLLIEHSSFFWDAIDACRQNFRFELKAWVLLPDHLHLIVDASGNDDVSGLLQRLKMSFASRYRKTVNMYSGRVWQNRFWDHLIRDEEDMNRHYDYIH